MPNIKISDIKDALQVPYMTNAGLKTKTNTIVGATQQQHVCNQGRTGNIFQGGKSLFSLSVDVQIHSNKSIYVFIIMIML